MRVPNRQMDSSSARVMMNPQRDITRISVRQKAIAEGVRVWCGGNVMMFLRMEEMDHLGKTST